MEVIFEILLQLVWGLFELLITLGGEALFDWGGRKVAKSGSREAGPVLTGLVSIVCGAAAGFLSLWLVPSHYISGPIWRWVHLAASTVVAGWLLAEWRRLRGAKTEAWYRDFANGCLFAAALGATRLFFAR